jgi:hypothetical protein
MTVSVLPTSMASSISRILGDEGDRGVVNEPHAFDDARHQRAKLTHVAVVGEPRTLSDGQSRRTPSPRAHRRAPRACDGAAPTAAFGTSSARNAREIAKACSRPSGTQLTVSTGNREAVGVANNGTPNDLHRQREVAHHLANDRQLLKILLAEVGVTRARDREQFRHHARDPIEVSRSVSAL